MFDPLQNFHTLARMTRSSGWPNTQFYAPSMSNQPYAMGGPPGTPWHSATGGGQVPVRRMKRKMAHGKRLINASGAMGWPNIVPINGGMAAGGFGYRPRPNRPISTRPISRPRQLPPMRPLPTGAGVPAPNQYQGGPSWMQMPNF